MISLHSKSLWEREQNQAQTFQDDFKNLLNSQKPNQLMMHLVMVVEVKLPNV